MNGPDNPLHALGEDSIALFEDIYGAYHSHSNMRLPLLWAGVREGCVPGMSDISQRINIGDIFIGNIDIAKICDVRYYLNIADK